MMNDWYRGKTYLESRLGMSQDNGGEWVHVEDVETLLTEVSRLKDQAERDYIENRELRKQLARAKRMQSSASGRRSQPDPEKNDRKTGKTDAQDSTATSETRGICCDDFKPRIRDQVYYCANCGAESVVPARYKSRCHFRNHEGSCRAVTEAEIGWLINRNRESLHGAVPTPQMTQTDLDQRYETTILCPDSRAGEEALHERMGEGWEFFCYWVEQHWCDNGPLNHGTYHPINHIAMRRPCSTETSDETETT